MKPNLPILFCAVLTLGLLSACNTVQSELVLMPVQMGTKTMVRADRTGTCVNLDRSVIAPSRLSITDGQIAAGYENTFVRGADPFPCNTRRNFAHQGAVLFDFSELGRRHAVVLEATLEADIRTPVFPEGIVMGMGLYRAGQAWAGGNFQGAPNVADPLAQIPVLPLVAGDLAWGLDSSTPGGGISSGLHSNVTRTVQSWVQNRTRLENHGFVLASLPEHSFAEENQNLIAVYSNIRLHLKILEPSTP